MISNIYPSILDASPTQLPKLLADFKNNGVKGLHVDVMDGVYVPTIGFSEKFVKWLSQNTEFYLDLHLMVTDSEKVIEFFSGINVGGITIHLNTSTNLFYVVDHLKKLGINPGVALNPEENPELIKPLLPFLHHVLVMTANPGRPSHGVIPEMTQKISWLKEYRKEHNLKFKIQTDGGVAANNAGMLKMAGCDEFISGGYLIKATNLKKNLELLSEVIS